MRKKPIRIEFEELCKLYPVEYKQDKDYPQITVFRNGIIYNQKTHSVTGHIKQNRIETCYGFAHRLVMKNFGTSAPEDMKIPTIDHIDELDFVDDIYGRHLNNDISNLQWMSGPDNIKKAYNNKLWNERRSKAIKESLNQPGMHEKLSKIQKEAQNRLEVRERQSRTLRKTYKQPGMLEKKSKIQKEIMSRPSVREKISKANKEAQNRPEVRERKSKAMREIQNRPEIRERKSKTHSKPIRCIETGISYSSQRIAAFYLGIRVELMSLYINGHKPDINGFHFERI